MSIRPEQSSLVPAERAVASYNDNHPVDLVHLARYTFGNSDLETELLELFHKQSMIYFDRLRQADGLRAQCEAAHSLKGCARGIGAWRVAELAEMAEFQAKTDQQSCTDELLGALQDSLSEANRFIKNRVA